LLFDLIAKGKVILEHPDKPKFLEGNVKRIQEGWDDTKKKAQDRLKLLQDTKEAWVGYAENNETIAAQFEVAEEEIKLVKKRYNLEDALTDMKETGPVQQEQRYHQWTFQGHQRQLHMHVHHSPRRQEEDCGQRDQGC